MKIGEIYEFHNSPEKVKATITLLSFNDASGYFDIRHSKYGRVPMALSEFLRLLNRNDIVLKGFDDNVRLNIFDASKVHQHKWKEYVGLTDKYHYCEICDEKRAEKPDEWEINFRIEF